MKRSPTWPISFPTYSPRTRTEPKPSTPRLDLVAQTIRDLKERRKVVGYVVENVRRRNGDTSGRWTGSTAPATKGGLTAEQEAAFDLIRSDVRRFPYSTICAKAIVGEGGYEKVPGLPVPFKDLDADAASVDRESDPARTETRTLEGGRRPLDARSRSATVRRLDDAGSEV